jgi:WD40 repeat protein
MRVGWLILRGRFLLPPVFWSDPLLYTIPVYSVAVRLARPYFLSLKMATPIELNDILVSNLSIAKTFSDHSAWINSISFSTDGQYLVTAGFDDVLNLYNISSGTR